MLPIVQVEYSLTNECFSLTSFVTRQMFNGQVNRKQVEVTSEIAQCLVNYSLFMTNGNNVNKQYSPFMRFTYWFPAY